MKEKFGFRTSKRFSLKKGWFCNFDYTKPTKTFLIFRWFEKDQAFAFFLVEEPKTFDKNEFEIAEKPKTFAENFAKETRKFETIKKRNYRAYNGCFKTPCIRRTHLKINLQKLTQNSKQKRRARSFWKLCCTHELKFTFEKVKQGNEN